MAAGSVDAAMEALLDAEDRTTHRPGGMGMVCEDCAEHQHRVKLVRWRENLSLGASERGNNGGAEPKLDS